MAGVMQELCDYEKGRLGNIKKNIELTKTLSLDVKSQNKSRFRKKRRRRYSNCSNSSSDSGDEWTPALETSVMKKKTNDITRVPVVENAVRDPLCDIAEHVNYPHASVLKQQKPHQKKYYQSVEGEEPSFESRNCKLLKEFFELFGNDNTEEYEDFEGFDIGDVGDVPQFPVSERYPKRLIQQKEYREDELSDEDEYLFCDNCEEIHHGDCPVHGPLLTLDPCSGHDEASLQYTSVFVPSELTVKPSKIPNAGLGVFATQFIPRRVRFGPYEGRRVLKEELTEGEDTNYMWEVKHFGEESYYIDGQSDKESNWLRFINCARNEDEQNLVAFQYHGNIYYRSFKHIYPGNELYIWYGEQYALELGITTSFEEDDYQFYNCKNCGSSFVLKSNFDLHLQRNPNCLSANPQCFTCQKCQESFCELYQLQDHIRKHELFNVKEEKQKKGIISNDKVGNPDNTCDYCGKKFSFQSLLKRHLHIHTGNKPYQCQYCRKGFNQSSSLKTHLRIHTGNKPYQCQYCRKGFNQSSSLKTHLRIHTGYKPYQCQYCGKEFNQNSSLQTHLRVHTGDKPYQCQYCGKGFNQTGHLQIHLRIHTGDKPYQCQYCGKEFSRNANLKSHLRIHTGDKLHQCQYCRKGFIQKAHLQTHLRIHTGYKPYQFQRCGKGFIQNGSLQSYLGIHLKNS